MAGDGRKAGESEDRVKEVIGDVIRGLEREKPGEEKMTLPDDPQTRKQEAAVQQVAQDSLQRERLQQMERDMVRDLNREKTLGGDCRACGLSAPASIPIKNRAPCRGAM